MHDTMHDPAHNRVKIFKITGDTRSTVRPSFLPSCTAISPFLNSHILMSLSSHFLPRCTNIFALRHADDPLMPPPIIASKLPSPSLFLLFLLSPLFDLFPPSCPPLSSPYAQLWPSPSSPLWPVTPTSAVTGGFDAPLFSHSLSLTLIHSLPKP